MRQKMHRLSDEGLIAAYEEINNAPDGTFDIEFIVALKNEVDRRNLHIPFAESRINLALLRNRVFSLKERQAQILSTTLISRSECLELREQLHSTFAVARDLRKRKL
ncbi:sporulation histidine kinase inhibitor Sda [Paenibacillus sp. TRM 82003]|nr:sporulation histidine kinase inhibitor Sda [Paenibacillus sp. TRM 82003]